MKVTYKKLKNKNKYNLYYGDHKIGEAVIDVDGYYYLTTWTNGGIAGSYTLRLIADALDEINQPWTDKIDADMETWNSGYLGTKTN